MADNGTNGPEAISGIRPVSFSEPRESAADRLQARKPAKNVQRKERIRSPATDAARPRRTGTRVHIDPESKEVIVQIVDENDNVIRQIPAEELLQLRKSAEEFEAKLFDKKV
jgi:uncharacterized FlaG/YvyC family protein